MDGAMANQYVQTDLRDFLAAVEAGEQVDPLDGLWLFGVRTLLALPPDLRVLVSAAGALVAEEER